ncbi:hypothetical protein C8A01DRAFT_48397 [Parachaetomium inaequale]|uniref:Sm domain-containing protein n=1 Tax=Parachaetomium inaequale TaxID=2588326 RepID=A0AAN6PG64_9PEZI|nr:hypothetical protein C8A01DRAFT_48397 [Parachaetomium inaequale]
MSTTSPSPPSKPTPAQKAEATSYLTSLLNKNLRVTTTDARMFWGTFKCTDPESNLVLQHTYEYRPPTAQQISDAAAAAATASGPGPGSGPGSGHDEVEDGDPGKAGGGKKDDKVKLDMTSRYLGLVVVPGQYIVRIEVEEFVSQMRGRQTRVLGVGEQAGGGFGMGGGVGAVGVS